MVSTPIRDPGSISDAHRWTVKAASVTEVAFFLSWLASQYTNRKGEVQMDVYEIVNKRITELLEAGCCPWLKPWNAATNMPRNLITKREYSGINVWLLNAMNYSSPYFASYRQITERGGHVRKVIMVFLFWKNRHTLRLHPILFLPILKKFP